MEYHVAKTGNDSAVGSREAPFLTISQAARVAVAGDSIYVHAGVYREWVSPANGGTEDARIVYQSAGDGEVIITGAERITDWKNEGGQVWSTEVDNSLFTVRNPFKEDLFGDWLFKGAFVPHLGDVYLNRKSLYEAESVEKLQNPQVWDQAKYSEDSKLLWYAEAGEETTKIWANFGEADPWTENVEISVRPFCFWPEKSGLNYITVRGFTLCQASPQWAPPTALQEGLIGPHWSKGWIIEDNVIFESKCVGVSLGKDISSGHNEWSKGNTKGGTQREQEVIFRALHGNWHKDNIGSHIVRNNIIHDCEQAGVVGHMGGAFSTITGNTIYNIHHKRIFHGAEVAGIKLHASLDTQITGNKIYACYRAVWLDWQAQGTRISRNVFFDNLSEDFFVEVCHGPYLVDHNLFLSKMNFRNLAQGGAFVHNLFAGRILLREEMSRWTPYHFPHETAVAGYNNFTGGDDRYVNNLFLDDGDEDKTVKPMTFFEHLPLPPRKENKESGQIMDGVPDDSVCYLYPAGLSAYDKYPDGSEKRPWEYTEEERKERIEKYGSVYPLGRWAIPVQIKGNAYFGGAVGCSHEPDAKVCPQAAITVELSDRKDKVYVTIQNAELLGGEGSQQLSADTLGTSYHAEMAYENPDGTNIVFDKDFFGKKRPEGNVTPGPFEVMGEDSQVAKFEL
ncbi:MAG: right-handed parallel beta-helix repeat-containing protein [Lachnospiraceae bacterium]|nr:right-handed parallel beta-helix repeat-containing protein [Lachnospiraceae bacterium]